MSSISDITDAIKSQFLEDSVLSDYTIYDFEDEMVILNDKKTFPFINIKCDNLKIEDADNMNKRNYERSLFNIIITFAVSENLKTTAWKNTWELYDAIRDAIETDRTFGGTVRNAPFRPDVATDVSSFDDGLLIWVGRGAMVFSVYNDNYVGG